MAIAYRSHAFTAGLTASTVVTKPAGVVSGDMLVASLISQTPVSASAPGWTVHSSLPAGAGITVLTKRAGSTEPASYTFTVTAGTGGTSDGAAIVSAYSGADRVRQVSLANARDASLPFPTPTSGNTADKVVRVANVFAGSSARTVTFLPTSGSGYIRRIGSNSGSFSRQWLVDENIPATARTLEMGDGTGYVSMAAATVVLALNSAPVSPTLVSPATNEVLNKDAVNRLSWQHSDPDGDGQSAYDLRYRFIGAASWTTVSGTGPNTHYDIPASTLGAGPWEWQVRTYDPAGLAGPYSASGFFDAAALPAGPAITAPISGETIGAATAVVTWTASAQTSYQVRKVADLAGSPNTSVVLYDSTEVVDSTTRLVTLAFDVNSRYEHVQVRVKANGLFSPWTSVRVLVSYTLPAQALLSVVPTDTQGTGYSDALQVSILNPAPTDGQPSRSYNRLFVTALSPGDPYRPLGVRKLVADLLVSSVLVDHRVASGVEYAFQVETVADNGTVSVSELVAEYRDLSGGGNVGGPEGDFADADFATSDFD